MKNRQITTIYSFKTILTASEDNRTYFRYCIYNEENFKKVLHNFSKGVKIGLEREQSGEKWEEVVYIPAIILCDTNERQKASL